MLENEFWVLLPHLPVVLTIRTLELNELNKQRAEQYQSYLTGRQAIVLDAFFYDLIGLIAVLIFYFNGTLNTLGLGAGIIYLFLTVGFGLFLFPKK